MNKLRSYLVGDKSRLIQCGEILLLRGHSILGVISEATAVQRWAIEKQIPGLPPGTEAVAVLKEQPFDLLLSIDNNWLIPDEVLSLAEKWAINFHDAPLPRYAGVNATNWALLNREQVHGITWHVMSEKPDEGDILKQRIFKVSDDDTALTLNAKCYQESLEAFSELLDELAEDRVHSQLQDLSKRTYYGRWRRPAAACIIDWNRSAHDIAALGRALDFGPYPNPLGLAKLHFGNRAIVAKEIKVTGGPRAASPGTITGADDRTLRVAARTGQVVLGGLTSFHGELVRPISLLHSLGLTIGDTLPLLQPDAAEHLTKINGELCRHENFWLRRLSSANPIEIPYAQRSHSSEPSECYGTTRFSFPREFLDFMRNKLTAGDALLAALVIYFYRLSDQPLVEFDFRNGLLRHLIAGAEAYFSSQVPFRVQVDPTQNFWFLCETLERENAYLSKHGSYARDLPLRDPQLYKKRARELQSSSALHIDRVENLNARMPESGFELAVVLPDKGNESLWRYDKRIFDTEIISRMQQQFAALLRNIALHPHLPVSELSVLPDIERHRILVEWNNTQRIYANDACLHQLIEDQVKRTPNRVALVFGQTELTYRQLDQRANQLAHHLLSLGVRPDVPVGIFVERSIEMVVGLLGILKTGGTYVPVDPEYPRDRIAFMLKDSQAPVLLTQEHLVASLPEYKGIVICMDSEWPTIAAQPIERPEVKLQQENLAYIIYTSGSTGTPKGAMNHHRGICNRLLWMQDTYRLTRADRVLQKTPFSFDVSVWEFFWTLLTGARLVMAPPGAHRDGRQLIRLIKEHGITTMHFVPSMLQIFLEEDGVEECRSLKRVICSGEALPFELQQRFFARSKAELHNLYGPTEAAVDVTYWPCQRGDSRSAVPIGYPVANTQMYILDQNLHPVPIGVAGELHIGGVQVGRGYLNRPELTAEKFIPDPFRNETGARLYKTGDLARYLPGGEIEYLGRLDHQVKIRGLRIELGEIESVLDEHSTVKQTVVTVLDDKSSDKKLVAYVVLNPGQELDDDELRAHLRIKLPEYMVPQWFVRLEVIPLSPNGKIDRKALPKPKQENIAAAMKSYVAPRSEVENMIASIWKEMLGLERVGINDNFFDLGGHSLLLIRVLNKLRVGYLNELSIVDLFRYPTVTSLSQFLTQNEQQKASGIKKVIEKTLKQKEFLQRQKKLTQSQRRPRNV